MQFTHHYELAKSN